MSTKPSSEYKLPVWAKLRNASVMTMDRASKDDAEEILQYLEKISSESNYLTFGPGEFKLSVQEEGRLLESYRNSKSNLALKGVVEGKIISLLTFTRPERKRISHAGEFGLSVLQKHWKLGAGRAMMKTFIAWAERSGVRKIELKVRSDNTAAINLYLSLGFKQEGVRPRGLCINDVFYEELYMGLAIDI